MSPTNYHLRLLLIGILLFSVVLTVGQQNDNWFLGHFAKMEFGSGTALAASGPLEALEGTASISDANGAVLFYTEGTTVWDRNDNVMPNGSGLLGGSSSTQAALIVPKPGACGIYYVFTTEDHFGNGDFRYSVVDMCLNSGMGDVVPGQKNILVATSCSEKITAVPHDNGTDYWVITHELGGNAFHAFRLTPNGLLPNPVTTAIGSSHASNCMIGPLKASHDGEHLVCEATFCNICEMFDFDASTGIVSNAINLVSQYGLPGGFYGVEFSPSDNVLYLATTWINCRLYQIDLLTSTLLQLQSINGNYQLGALQLAPDGRIYMARTNQPFLDVINDPDVSGAGCNYLPAGFALAPGTTSDVGMPCMIPATIMQPAPTTLAVDLGNDTTYCGASPFVVSAPQPCGATYMWQDGTTQSTMSVNAPGIYWVEVTAVCGSGVDSLVVDSALAVALPPVSGCAWTPLDIVAQVNGFPTTWSWDFGDGSTSTSTGGQEHTYFNEGLYAVTVVVGDSSGNCTDTAQVSVLIGAPETAGVDSSVLHCTTDAPFNLFDLLSTYADVNGTWLDAFGSPAPSSFDPSVDPPGSFQYVISGVHCGPDTAWFTVDVQFCMGSGEVTGANMFPLFPVPAQDVLWVTLPERMTSAWVTLFDGQGKTVRSNTITSLQTRSLALDLVGIRPGTYLLYIVSDDGRIWKRSFVKAD